MKHLTSFVKKAAAAALLGLLVIGQVGAVRNAVASPLGEPNPAPPHVIRQVAASEDDVSQSASGALSLSGSTLPMGDTGSESQFIGLRFSSVTVPQGSQIVGAWLTFTSLGDNPGVTTLSISGHAVDTSPSFSSGDGPVERQAEYTAAQAAWNPIAWADGVSYDSSDISDVIQEIIDRPAWIPGNAISLFVLDDGAVNNVMRQAVSWDLNPLLAPTLTIEFQEPLVVVPQDILAEGDFQVEPPPGFEPIWIASPDYLVQELSLHRGWELISTSNEYYDWGLNWYQPFLDYQLTIGNNGEPLPEEQAEYVAGQTLVRNLEGTINSVGSEGKFYYYQLDNAAPMCFPYGLLAFIPNGLSGDPNPANDWGLGTIGDVGPFDRDLRFLSGGPSAAYWGPGSCSTGLADLFSGTGTICGDFDSGSLENPSPESSPYLRIRPQSEAIGSCPPLLSDTEPFYFPDVGLIEPEADRYHVWVTVYLNGDFIALEGPLPPDVNPAISLPEDLNNNDVICVEVDLDPPYPGMDHGFILETSETNNHILQIYVWNTNIWRGNAFYLIGGDTEPPFPTCVEASQDIAQFLEENATTSAIMVGGLFGAIILGFAGGTVGRFFGGRVAGLAGNLRILVAGGVVGGLALGGFLGIVAGSALTPIPTGVSELGGGQDEAIQFESPPLLDLSSLLEPDNTCGPYFKTYAEAVTNDAGDVDDILIHIAVPGDVTLPAGSQFQITLWDTNGLPRQFATTDTLLSLSALGFFPDQISSPLVWQIEMEVLAGAGGDLFLPYCLPDGLHTFKYDDQSAAAVGGRPTPTPSPTAEILTQVPPTATFTPAPPQDTSPPKVGNINASPNPALTTSPVTVSANITDTSGVASVILYYRTGKSGYTQAGAMKPGGGNTYVLNLGTLIPAGTYDFRILATDALGNATCGAKNLPSCPGGTFNVNIP